MTTAQEPLRPSDPTRSPARAPVRPTATGPVVLLGRQGSGKGTQGELLAARHGWAHVSLGDELRRAVRAGTPLGRRVQDALVAGELVPDDVAVAVVRAALLDASDGCVLDGFPRTVRQAELLAGLTGGRAGVGVHLAVDPEVVVRRIAARRVCVRCERPAVAVDGRRGGVCAHCGAPVVAREDDAPAVVRRRLALHEEISRPLIDWYARSGRLVTVDGHGDPEVVADAVERGLTRWAGTFGRLGHPPGATGRPCRR